MTAIRMALGAMYFGTRVGERTSLQLFSAYTGRADQAGAWPSWSRCG